MLNFFNNKSTNDSAESFNGKIKIFSYIKIRWTHYLFPVQTR
ncbi:hypothetical protein E2R66_16780 [Mucilaginibacter psychrotolerans]|uniref:Transposase n=1 Tax=Mucilaginibacter psychrotolerans TaxID=1524096 RepID=A0A4Y8SB84_9SPHI|nr:hypothetical protein E2R66_16780 [Mucilaginibacter psychrotolerans]